MPKKRCAMVGCNKKLASADEIIGLCKCNNLYCVKHRMPENHKCTYCYKIDKDKFINDNLCVAKKLEVA